MDFFPAARAAGRGVRRYWPLFWLLLAPLAATSLSPRPAPLPPLRVRAVAPDVFVHTSYRRQPGRAAPVAAHGLVVSSSQGALLLDAGASPEYTAQLLRWVTDSLHQRVRLVVVTHPQALAAGGLAALRAQHLRVYSTPRTARHLRQQQPAAPAPTPALKPYTRIRAGRTRLELFFPGPDAAPDHVVAWLPHRRVLFTGEAARAGAGASPAAARAASWAARARVVVPGLGQWPESRPLSATPGGSGRLRLLGRR